MDDKAALHQTPKTISSGIRDNYLRGSVADFLHKEIRAGSQLAIVSAYFTIYAYDRLKDQLDSIAHLDFLFGDPQFIKSVDPEKTEAKSFAITDQGMAVGNQLRQRALAKQCAEWIRDCVDIRSIKYPGFLHGKLYHITQPNGIERAIFGSSNFTVSGLGLSQTQRNVELNLIVSDDRDRNDLKNWFDELWQDKALVADVKQDVLDYLAQLYSDHSPEFVYFKTLYHLFEDFLAQQQSGLLDDGIAITETETWKMLYEFQKDGVKGAINKILRHNGCILADSVGLGKTFEALAVIKYFELRNERVLVLCPKKLEDNWTLYRNNDTRNPLLQDRFRYDVLAHTDLSRETGKSNGLDLATLNWGNYDLVVIDESHNFRNNTKGRRDEDGNVVRQSRYERLMQDVIQGGIKTKVLLLSATPVNNNLGDLRNQIYFATEGNDDAFASTIGIASIKGTLQGAQKIFTNWAKKKGTRRVSELLEDLGSGFFTLMDELTIARSRAHIKRHYASSFNQMGGFPDRAVPRSIYPEIDLKRHFPSYDILSAQIDKYQLSIFKPSKYVRPEHAETYGSKKITGFTQADRENFLIGMMKVNFLKRLESSVYAFALTMQNTIAKIDRIENRIARYTQYRAENPDLDFDSLTLSDDDDPELRDALEVGQKLVYKMAHLDVDAWLADLARDKNQLRAILLSAQNIDAARDAKLAELKQLITEKVQQPTTTKDGRLNRKVLVFTAFADTAGYLFGALKTWARGLNVHIALVTGGDGCQSTLGNGDYTSILTNFSPISKSRDKLSSMPQDDEIDLLIATDCISEGQNLQDCDLVINYDIHWNPVRIIQRFGRIDRIGSLNTAVHLVNFWPTPDLDHYVKLKSRVEARMALVDIAATNEDNLLKGDIEDLIKEDLRYRDKQLLRLRTEVLDMDDFNEQGVSLSEFTLDDFRFELTNYIERNKAALRAAPLGLYAVVPPAPNQPIIAPGVVYCLRQKQTPPAERGAQINPLSPYYLVYVRDDGTVRYGFAAPKQILAILRELCAGKTQAHEDLCRVFDKQTQNGAEMTFYNDLLKKAVASIEGTFKKRAVGNLLSGRGGVLPIQAEQVTAQTDFDLVTWLVIHG